MNVLIVDDDCLVRESLQKLINWESQGLKIIDTAIDGIDAMEKLDALTPDIVILDMSMPQADGIEVIKHINNQSYSTKILALSCYDDFTYVKEALRLGASDYILKHLLKPETLIDALQSIVGDIHQSTADSKQSTQMKVLANEGRPLLKNKLLSKILTGGDYAGSKESDFKRLCKNLPNNNLGLIYFRVTNYKNRVQALQPNGEEILALAVTNIMREEVDKCLPNEVVDMGKGEYAILIHLGSKSQSTIKILLEQVIHNIHKQLYTFLNVVGNTITSIQLVTLNKLCDLYAELHHKYYHFFYEPKETHLIYSDFYPYLKSPKCELDHEKLESYKNIIRSLDFEKLEKQVLLELKRYIDIKIYPPELLRHYAYIIRVLEDYIYDVMDLKMKDLFERTVIHQRPIEELMHWEELKRTVIDLITDAKQMMERTHIDEVNNDYVREAIKYIQGHYMEDINLGEVAAKIHVTRTYLSHLFNQETGTKFIDYVREARIKQACVFLRTTNKSIKDIAMEVGIPNRKYFSKTFKKVIGMSPQEYKRENI